MLSFLVLLALAFGFLNGFHDAANSIATVVSTRVLRPLQAVAWAAAFNFLAIAAAADRRGGNDRRPAWSTRLPIDPAVDVRRALPARSSGTSSRCGSAYPPVPRTPWSAAWSAQPSPAPARARWWPTAFTLFLLFVLLSPLIGLALGVVLMVAVVHLSSMRCRRARADRAVPPAAAGLVGALQHRPRQQRRPEDGRHHLAAAARRRHAPAPTAPPGWVGVRQLCRRRGRHAVRRLAHRQDHGPAHRQARRPAGGFCAESAGAGAIHLASFFGIPISTTQTITASIVGVGIVNRLSSVRWGVAGVILWAWLLTLPAAGLLGALGLVSRQEMF